MSVRLLMVLIGNLLWGAIIVVVVLVVLPRMGIDIPLPGLIALLAVFVTYAVVTYRIGSRALSRKPVGGLASMVGSRGTVVAPLNPRGTVRVQGELWEAVASKGNIAAGEEIVVVGQKRLRLTVERVKKPDDRD